MVVTRSEFRSLIAGFAKPGVRSLDCEATGLRAYKGDRLFSIIIAEETEAGPKAYYFNFQAYPGVGSEHVLPREWLTEFQAAFDEPGNLWFIHNAKYDLALLAKEGLTIAGTVHCTLSIDRVVRNDHMAYDLDACAKRLGLAKSDAVDQAIQEMGLWDWIQIPGKKSRQKDLHFDRVPYDIIVPYGLTDGLVTLRLGLHQLGELSARVNETPENVPPPEFSLSIERRFTKTAFHMERVGIKIDRSYCERASQVEMGRLQKAAHEFELMSGIPFKDSPKVLEKAFTQAGETFPLTEKGNPSFKGEVLKGMTTPLAKIVQEYRDAHKKWGTYYQNFLFFADEQDVVHANLRQTGTGPGRCSCADPNLQNLTKEDEDADLVEDEDLVDAFEIKRSFVPRPGFFFLMKDYRQMEYRLMIDYAGEMGLIEQVKAGLDVHDATAAMVGVSRKYAKTLNFGLLYGMGNEKLARALGIKIYEAKELRYKYFDSLPNVQRFSRNVMKRAESRGFIYNWAGRRCYFSKREFAYKAPNHLIQGGCGYIVKHVQNELDTFLAPFKSRMVMQVHDEVLFEIHETEKHLIPEISRIMEETYKPRFLPLTTSSAWSDRSWADKREGVPN